MATKIDKKIVARSLFNRIFVWKIDISPLCRLGSVFFFFFSFRFTSLHNSYWCCYCTFCCSSFSFAVVDYHRLTKKKERKKNLKCIFMSPLLSSLQCMTVFLKRVCTMYTLEMLSFWLSLAFCNCKHTRNVHFHNRQNDAQFRCLDKAKSALKIKRHSLSLSFP